MSIQRRLGQPEAVKAVIARPSGSGERVPVALEAELAQARKLLHDAKQSAAAAAVEAGDLQREAAALRAELGSLRSSVEEKLAAERARSKEREVAIAATAADALASAAEETEKEFERAVAEFGKEVSVLRDQIAGLRAEREQTQAAHAEEMAREVSRIAEASAGQLAGAIDEAEAVRRQAESTVQEISDRIAALSADLQARTAERDRLTDELVGASGELEAAHLRLRDEGAARAALEEKVALLQAEVDHLQFEILDRAADSARPRGLFRRPKEMAPIRKLQPASPPQGRKEKAEPAPPIPDAELDSVLERRLFGS